MLRTPRLKTEPSTSPKDALDSPIIFCHAVTLIMLAVLLSTISWNGFRLAHVSIYLPDKP